MITEAQALALQAEIARIRTRAGDAAADAYKHRIMDNAFVEAAKLEPPPPETPKPKPTKTEFGFKFDE